MQRRELKALLSQLERYKGRQQRGRNRLAAQLSRHWPESLELLGLDAVSLLEVLGRYGDAAQVAADRAGAEALLRRCGRAGLSAEKIEALLRSATQTVGVACVDGERALLQSLARDVLCSRRQGREVERPGAVKGKCVVALMRKLLQALWHLARGAEFDARKLFNLEAIGA